MKRDKNQNTSHFDWKSWAALIRLPNVFTVIADVTAAFFLVLGGSGWNTGRLVFDDAVGLPQSPWSVLAVALVSAISLYWAGMILNDLFDVRRDARARSNRPLPSRKISLHAARLAGWGLLLLGLVPVIALAGWSDAGPRWMPAIIAAALAVSIVLYDGPLKRTAIAPVLMGLCRTLSFLLGAAAATVAASEIVDMERLGELQSAALGEAFGGGITPVVLTFALGMGVYIGGLTTFGRREAIGDRSIHLPIGLVAMTIGAMLLAWAPRTAAIGSAENNNAWMTAWRVDPVLIFPAAILLMLATTLLRARAATVSPSPRGIQATISSGLLAIIPLAAAITMLAVGAEIAIVVFALLMPSRLLANRFQMT